MSNAALRILDAPKQLKGQIYLAYSNAAKPQTLLSRRGNIPVIAAVLVTLQVLDGLLTYTGMQTFGLAAEGNPLLRSLMNTLGILPGIALVKLCCIGTVLALSAQAHRISWLPAALTCVAGIYAVAAIVPWSWLLLSEYFA